jgi:nucleoside-diphosphate-sugar epimerase
MNTKDLIINFDDPILITGSNGFIGTKVVETLLKYGFNNLRCFVRPSGDMTALNKVLNSQNLTNIEILKGNLLSPEDCKKAAKGISIIIHLAAGVGKSYPTCFLNSVVTTRNLLEAALEEKVLKRFLNVSSFAVYSPSKLKRGELLDETCEVENRPEKRGEAYCYGKVKQDELVMEYGKKYNIPYVIVRPGAVYGPGKNAITGRIGIDTFGIYFHMGGTNQIPFTYVDNCADAMVMASIKKKVDGEIFNIVDDDLPVSFEFLKLYKEKVKPFKSINVNHRFSYLMCFFWEKYSRWSEGQLPPVFNRSRWAAEWKGHRYSNQKLKNLIGWNPKITTDEALKRYFEFSKKAGGI